MINKILVLVLVIGMVGCGSTGTSGKAEGPDSKKAQNIPASSKFSKMNVGMTQSQMMATLGKPSQTYSHPSGKQFRPFYFGHDFVHTTYVYNGEGRIELDSDGNVDAIEYNPKETGK